MAVTQLYRRTLVGTIFLVSASSAWGQVFPVDLEAQVFQNNWNEGGASGTFNLPYRIFKPTNFNASAPGTIPLVIWLHGAGERGTDNLSQLASWGQPMGFVQSAVQTQFPSFFVAPQAPQLLDPSDPRYIAAGEYWVNNYVSDPDEYRLASVPPSRSLTSVFALVDSLKTQFPMIDPKRVYITGWSSGGDGVWYSLLTRPDLFAAGIPIAGLGDPTAVAAAGLKDRGIWAFQGSADGLVPLTATTKMVDAIEASGGLLGNTASARLRESVVPGANHFNVMDTVFGTGVFDQNLGTNPTYAWLFNQSLVEPTATAPEPGTLALVALGALVLRRRSRRRSR